MARNASKYHNTAEVEFYTVNYDDKGSLVSALKDVDSLLDMMGQAANALILVDAAVEAGIDIFFPSEYGVDYEGHPYEEGPLFKSKAAAVKYAKGKGLRTVFELVVEALLIGMWICTWVLCHILISRTAPTLKIGSGDYEFLTIFTRDAGFCAAALAYRDQLLSKSKVVSTVQTKLLQL